VAVIKPRSHANGPGVRSVIWTQGCSLRCEGCFNQSMQPFEDAMQVNAKTLAHWLAALPVAGLTVSGGEPFDQATDLYDLLCFYKACCDKTILLFTGYTFDELKRAPEKMRSVLIADAIISGRFTEGLHWENKKLILPTGRIKPSEITPQASIEMDISGSTLFLTGYPILHGISRNDLHKQGIVSHA